jgi:hypothetical protein
VLPEPALRSAADVLDDEAYGSHAAPDDDRRRAETALVDAAARWPA